MTTMAAKSVSFVPHSRTGVKLSTFWNHVAK
eukprot:CAMPEP_0171116724 /NCGR_PEP_ID=MMETSP0766_2-20121228/90891_1 /TAXON_ID=439317 /ORGANISM="Gambierdiscus australes, Strain CAWD 149" /LENGTH=30 /DNA_ID= /DNA_START= /DNA_END= /DNA_ORIENTATION=